MRSVLHAALSAAICVALSACSNTSDSSGLSALTTTPSPTTGTTETFSGTVDIGGTDFHPFTVAASGRSTGTDADAMHISRGGVPCGLVGLPLRYMHSPVEMVDLADIENAAKLIAAAAQRLATDASFLR